jgi:hypothetical protein
MAHGLDTYWLQLGDEVENPYGEGHPMKIDWPDKVEAEAPEITEMPALWIYSAGVCPPAAMALKL